MSQLNEWWGPGRTRTASLRALLPTDLPGISFTSRGRVWFRQVTSADRRSVPVRAARAATLSKVYTAASGETEKFAPEAAFQAEQAVAVALANWQELEKHSPVTFRARLALDLVADNAAKAERFTEARRAARLDEALVEDHMKFLRDVALKDESTACLWWLHRNLTGSEPATSWDDFDRFVRPLITSGDPTDPMTRFTQAMLSLTKRIHEDPPLGETLANVAALTLKTMDEAEIAREIASFSQSFQPGQPGPNGTTPPTNDPTDA